MNRREYLRLIGGVAIVATAGCSGESDENFTSTIQDSDNDGVIDSHDYAPGDPAVQEKADLVSSTTVTPTSSTPESSKSTTIESEATQSNNQNKIKADIEDIRGFVPSYFEWYSVEEAKLAFNTDLLDFPADKMDVYVGALEYPRKASLDYDRMEPIPTTGSGITRFETTYDLEIPENTHFSLLAMLIDPSTKLQDVTSKDTVTLGETDRLIIQNGNLKKSPHPEAKNSLTTSSYERIVGEGVYGIKVNGNSDGVFTDAVDFALYAYKSVYIKESNRSLESMMNTIRNSIQNGIAGELAQIMYDSADKAGYSSAREKVEYAIRATQQLPYVSDVGSGYDGYNKYPIETLVEAGGDCEDTTILLGSVLTAEPFNYGMVLLELPPDEPKHVALGIKGAEDLQGSYYNYNGNQYYYIETTGEGWDIGEIPDEYKDMSASITPIQV